MYQIAIVLTPTANGQARIRQAPGAAAVAKRNRGGLVGGRRHDRRRERACARRSSRRPSGQLRIEHVQERVAKRCGAWRSRQANEQQPRARGSLRGQHRVRDSEPSRPRSYNRPVPRIFLFCSAFIAPGTLGTEFEFPTASSSKVAVQPRRHAEESSPTARARFSTFPLREK